MARMLASLEEVMSLLRAAAVSAGPDVARAAVFDADGTLWRGDIGDTAFEAADDAGLVDEATWAGPVREWAARWQVELPDDQRAGIARIMHAARAQELALAARRRGLPEDAWREDLYCMQAWVYAGRRRDAIAAFGARLFRDGFGDGIYADMRALLDALAADGFEVWIASASHGALLAPGAALLGVPDTRALGMEPALDTAGVTLARIAVCTYGPGKAEAARRALGGRRPLAAFGDSVLATDRELLALAEVPVAVAARGAHRQAALAHPRMSLFDPQR